jgi:hypothetical protein
VRIRVRAAILVAVVLVAGCGGGAKVSGTVTLDGQVLKAGTVTFHPTGSGPTGIGTISPDGRYEIAVGTDKSLPPGDYVVTVEATEAAIASAEQPVGTPPRPPAPPKRFTPAKYADRGTSDLKFTVKPGENKIDLALKGP